MSVASSVHGIFAASILHLGHFFFLAARVCTEHIEFHLVVIYQPRHRAPGNLDPEQDRHSCRSG